MIKSLRQLNQEFLKNNNPDEKESKIFVESNISDITAESPCETKNEAQESQVVETNIPHIVTKFQYEAKSETQKIQNTEASLKSMTRETLFWKDLLFLGIKIAIIVLAFVLLFTFLFGIVRYRDPSMDPIIKDGDLVIFYRYTKSGYLPGDVTVLEYNWQKQIRRVIATAGDTVDITEDGLVINGALQQELGIYQKTERYADGVDFPLTVPEGQVFVLGDNRTGAADSRIYGCVKIKDTFGKVMTVIRRRSI